MDVRRLLALCAIHDVELDGLAFGQRLESVPFNRGEVYEHVFAGLLPDETEALGLVEPLDCTLQRTILLRNRPHLPRAAFPSAFQILLAGRPVSRASATASAPLV